MSFTSFSFFIFFSFVYVFLWIAKKTLHNQTLYPKVNELLLTVVSYIFVTIADWRFSICLFLLTLLVYFSTILMEKNRLWVLMGLIGSVAQLAVFKYYNFFIESFSKVFGVTHIEIHIIAPLGISFYTFSAISYLIDIYRRKYAVRHDFWDVAFYMSFFPKLSSGPIVRTECLLNQLDEKHVVSTKNLEHGVQIALCGYFKKMVLADHLAVFVDNVFEAPVAFSSGTVFLATIAYSLQIYFDFSGYSDIAIGLAKIMGFDFDKNFDLPYISLNPSEFWKRWHISLSSWLQEYLYYPLGGNRKGNVRTYINLMLTMMIGGLWHGASGTFLIWGTIHGVALVLHKLFIKWKVKYLKDKNAGGTLWKATSMAMTFFFVNFCWIFFRAENLSNGVSIIRQILSFSSGIKQPYTWTFFGMAILILEIVFSKRKDIKNRLHQNYLILDLSKISQLTLFFILIGLTILMAYIGDTSFIYGRF